MALVVTVELELAVLVDDVDDELEHAASKTTLAPAVIIAAIFFTLFRPPFLVGIGLHPKFQRIIVVL